MKPLKTIKWALLAGALGFFIYFMLGLLLPFSQLKEVSGEFSGQKSEAFLSDNTVMEGERAQVVETAEEALRIRLEMLSQAKESIVLATFDMRDCESTRDLAGALLEAADRGVDVKILVDGVSGMLRMKKPLFQLLGSHENIEIRLYNEPNVIKPWTINGRMHDKYIIVDDAMVLMGGRNTFDYFLGAYTDKNLSLDREVFILSEKPENEQSAAAQMKSYFESVWDYKECRPLYDKESYGEKKKVAELKIELENRYEALKSETPGLFSEMDFVSYIIPIDRAVLLYNPIHILGKEPWLWYQLKELMLSARDRVYIHTPYAVFSDAMYEDMTEICEKTGQVTMQLNAIENGDNVCASSDYIHNKPEILETGVTIYEYDGGKSSHGKSVMIDNDISVIGSFNFDMRSAYVDTELMFVIYGEEFTEILDGYLKDMEQDSRLVLSPGEYEDNPSHIPQEISDTKRGFYKAFGWIMKPFRYLL